MFISTIMSIWFGHHNSYFNLDQLQYYSSRPTFEMDHQSCPKTRTSVVQSSCITLMKGFDPLQMLTAVFGPVTWVCYFRIFCITISISSMKEIRRRNCTPV